MDQLACLYAAGRCKTLFWWAVMVSSGWTCTVRCGNGCWMPSSLKRFLMRFSHSCFTAPCLLGSVLTDILRVTADSPRLSIAGLHGCSNSKIPKTVWTSGQNAQDTPSGGSCVAYFQIVNGQEGYHFESTRSIIRYATIRTNRNREFEPEAFS